MGGRPAGPTSDTEAVVLTAALRLLLDEGPAALTAQRLFQVTGVSRTTIYRHWPTPGDVLAALIDVAPIPPGTPSGDLATDLHAEVDRLCDRLRDRPVAAFLQALVVAGAVELRHRYVGDLLAPFHEVLRAAGVPDDDREDGVAMIASPLLLDALLLDRTAARARAHRITDTFTGRLRQP
ncbi:putative TetR-family transcriptional regulator [Actinoplanes missouriensis 431]|uniref:Putative TetR-family transcriptional regulator n=1 Tax=Actinoplanes missouriensis (strain ATCC 14538 / DSM 43046 / CBS 188.64 / JCM 3121 / NBRC 102363 / NCIMB 12654 / NRRL B-3342 / UNCC 431) TaxID=512565 RepID=I0GY86_ACTM4|nr:TetR/AcrR family transcriptional regulator [Actinoplanes missouriensis]BAL85723.1 putative TetR-family transcriptional regulator [Actinoplanes missouriensis 431]